MPSSILRAGVLFGRDSGPPPPIPAALVGRFMDTPQMSGRGMAESDLALFLEPRFVEGLNPWGNPDYGSCCYMHDGSAIFFPDNAQMVLANPASDWALEFWVRLDDDPTSVVTFAGVRSLVGVSNNFLSVNFDPATNQIQGRFTMAATGRTVYFAVPDPGAFFNGQWHHILFQRRGPAVEIYVDGVVGAGTHNAGKGAITNMPATYRFRLSGAYNNATSDNIQTFTGYMDEFRFTVGSPRAAGNFTPPASPYPRGASDPLWANVRALVSFDEDFGLLLAGETANLTPFIAGSQFNMAGTINTKGLLNSGNVNLNAGLAIADDRVDLGAQDFTFEIYMRGETHNNGVFDVFSTGGDVAPILVSTSGVATPGRYTVTVHDDTGAAVFSEIIDRALPDDHVLAVVREGAEFRVYFNGALFATHTAASVLAPFAGKTLRFLEDSVTNEVFLKAFRIVRGHALYAGPTYTPPFWEELDTAGL